MIACQTELDCLYCGRPTLHTVFYASLYIKRIVCHRCAHVVEKPAAVLLRQYCRDLPWRASALARRLKHEAQADPLLFVSSLPRRVVNKPIELSRELAEVCL
ncbi:hypothetical protein [Thermogemmatispora sp.]|jgi:recombinational DNA repair protein (RecF pathway)|uniref:hypothetical protein n=1 Tax=Thermogemmatispora sp. TaxID=1968838 RepID=UPI0035E4365F